MKNSNLKLKFQNFICLNCKKMVSYSAIGTHHRNHCSHCLWSKHVDKKRSGDRNDSCQGMMEPIGIAFKKEKKNKYGKEDLGEIMLIHLCTSCGKKTKNRLSGDDNPQKVIEISENSNLTKKEKEEVKIQLFGKDFFQ